MAGKFGIFDLKQNEVKVDTIKTVIILEYLLPFELIIKEYEETMENLFPNHFANHEIITSPASPDFLDDFEIVPINYGKNQENLFKLGHSIINTLQSWSDPEEVLDQVMLDEYNVNIANEVFTSLHTHHDNHEIKRSAYNADKKFLFESGYLKNNLIQTMGKWSDNAGLQIAGLKLFILSDSVRYQCFLEDIHIKVIQSLERFVDNETIQEVGIECLSVLCAAEIKDLICECLYVMGLTPDLKSKMLCSCTKGVLVGAECLLELGADVNYTDGETTPLCHAVINQDEDLDISNLHKPLKLSLEVGQDTIVANVITGHILGCIGDRSVVFPVFESSEQEADEWKCTTLTGANVPYNPADPRHKGSTEKLYFPEKISDNESRRSSVVLNNNIEVVLLDVSSNKISDIQNLSDCDREFWAKFTCLQKISMSYNKLQTLPEELFKVCDLLNTNSDVHYNGL
ncbi:unnamed protein product [Mytilus edulis]|uniref:LRRK2 ARM repeat domain-containing protein n=1 Tax=Mytilus edulis TaxID=6550 RepID=A0A8S3R221_MYTED|nr:unnamed protein product [Mytilus edulis]